ncbi:DUF2061 domain-containing protein [Actibacterium ureilyticum]|uniref:DUF2061 domain-containing protein n=1 Tax=Actibacterium ureilyticum TaxID=1590614 RepID=UPI000BAAC8EE|nr:DUF2061 domain-containing protein [Actibacterium ureilyticum]
METRKRTMVKAVLWNLIGLLAMLAVGFAATGSLALGGGMALVNTGLGFTLYILYERVWSRIAWGRDA